MSCHVKRVNLKKSLQRETSWVLMMGNTSSSLPLDRSFDYAQDKFSPAGVGERYAILCVRARALHRRLQFRSQCQHFVHRCQLTRVPTVGKVGQVVARPSTPLTTSLQAHQVVANELPRGHSIALLIRQVPRPHHTCTARKRRCQLARRHLDCHVTICCAFGQHVPDLNQQCACSHDDGCVCAQPFFQPRILAFPLIVVEHRNARGFHHDPAQVFAP